MRPTTSILDSSFRYVPAVATSVTDTWRRFGWRPTAGDARKRRKPADAAPAVPSPRQAVRIDEALPKPTLRRRAA